MRVRQALRGSPLPACGERARVRGSHRPQRRSVPTPVQAAFARVAAPHPDPLPAPSELAAALAMRGERETRLMLGRTANDLFWMSRYIERAENTARLLEVGYRIALLPREGHGQNEEWRSTLRSAGCDQGYLAKHGTYDTSRVVRLRAVRPRQFLERLLLPRHRPPQRPRPAHRADPRDVGEPQRRLAGVLGHRCRRPGAQCPAAAARLDQGAVGHVPRRAPQHDPAQRHLLVLPARHLPGARRQHRPHPGREVLCAAAPQRAGRRRDRQRAVGRDPALGVGAPQLPLGLQGQLQALAHRGLSDPQPADAPLAALLLRGDHARRWPSSGSSTAPSAARRRWHGRSLRELAEGDMETIFQSGLHEFLADFIARNNRLGDEISTAYHFTDSAAKC